ncbi:hypothetical protein TruAng_011403 [Truncatella angustata]|nr:hypothetical protein TruAng_011403 [Truncatella angustata]
MAQYGSTVPIAAPRGGQQAVYANAMPMHAPTAPAGTFSPGTKIQVGEHRVVIQKYLSEGGFAHVYLVKLPKPVDGTDLAVLKRVAVPDRDTLRGMRTEVETMKRLKGHRPIVTYIDSHASEIRGGGGGFEVFLLMEFCDGGGLIDFMNTRLQHRLTEPEILNIFTDIAEGVACMHYLKPPLLHRDLKVENVLITMIGSRRKFKLCDFGSAAPPKPAPQSIVECRLMDEDVQKHTTMQYRSPEMVDVYRKQPIDEKSDIWALGVLLYKLCYYTTPFEDQGQLAILNASYKFPSYPVFSDRLKQLIGKFVDPALRHITRQVLTYFARGVECKDSRSRYTMSEPSKQAPPPSAAHSAKSSPVVGAVFSPPQEQKQKIPEVVPMRRGRLPAVAAQPPAQAPKPSPSPGRVTNGDPFAALDSRPTPKVSVPDEISHKFPSLDQFSILHEQGTKFEFDSPISPPGGDLSQTVAERLADDAFVVPHGTPPPSQAPARQSSDLSRVKPIANTADLHKTTPPPGSINKPSSAPPKPEGAQKSRASAIISSNPELQAIASSPVQQPAQATPSRPAYVSAGTMTSTPPPQEPPKREYPPIYRFPPSDHHRSSSLPRQPDMTAPEPLPRANTPQQARPGTAQRVASFLSQTTHIRQSSSARPSLEGGRPSADFLEPLAKSASQSGRPRPVSTHLESNLDFLREREAAPRPLRSPGLTGTNKFPDRAPSPALEPQDDTNIESNVDFLRSMEEIDNKKKDKSTKHSKRGSLSSLSSRFGDAFKRFEGGSNSQPARTPSPLKDLDRRDLTPIAGSEATDSKSDDGRLLGDQEEMTPEQRREVEARALAEEERRVEAAAAEYRQRMAARESGGLAAPPPRSIGGKSRAVSIQNRVQNLLQESQKPSNAPKTAEGYGRFSDAAVASTRVEKALPELPRKPVGIARGPPPTKPVISSVDAIARTRHTSSMPAALPSSDTLSNRPSLPLKPNAPPKPVHLNSIPTGGRRSPSKQQRPPGPALMTNTGTEQLVGVGMPGRPSLDMTPQEKEDYIRDFSKRFPSLSAIEMVERDLGAEDERQGGR